MIKIQPVRSMITSVYSPRIGKVRERVPWSHLLYHRKRRIRKKAPGVIARHRPVTLMDALPKYRSVYVDMASEDGHHDY